MYFKNIDINANKHLKRIKTLKRQLIFSAHPKQYLL